MRRLTGYQLVLLAVIVLIVVGLVVLSTIDPSSKDQAETSSAPRRIVSLGPVITHILIELDAGEHIVGNTNYCPRLPDAKKEEAMEKVGTLTEMNVEKVINLKPDLVLAVGLTKPAGMSKLRDADIEVIRFHDPQSFDELCDQYVRIGTRIGREEKARKIVEDARSEVARIRKSVSALKPKRVFVQIGANPLYTVTRKSFINDFILFCGGINVAADRPIGRVRTEDVLEADPDVIVIATMGKVNQQQKEIWMRYKSLSAVGSNDVHTIDSYGVCSPTPQMFVKTLKQLVKLIRPEL